MRRLTACAAVVVAVVIGTAQTSAAQTKEKNPGLSNVCGSFGVRIDDFYSGVALALNVGLEQLDRPDEGWAWVDRAKKIRSATGVARNPHVAPNDTPANHDSHDVDFEIRLDPGQEDLLTVIQDDALPIEWESGLDPVSDKKGDGAATFPKWAWPSDGDRVWAEGHWVLDCGHPDGRYHAEIHPPRAFASMRNQAAPLPGSGITPVPVTLTDLFISGRGGYTPQLLNCGPDIILGLYGDSCGHATPPADDSYKTTPINDTDFTFDVCLPPRPSNTVFSSIAVGGPGNTVAIAPIIDGPIAAAGGCLGDPQFDQSWMARITVPLKGTATAPDSVYARRIYAGWLSAPDPVLQHRRVKVTSTNLREDHDLDPGDGELTFWWVNVDRAPWAWLRLSDFADGNMDDYDDEFGSGDGEMTYSKAGGPTFDFYLRPNQDFSVRSRGFEQDCFDNGGFVGLHRLRPEMYIGCYLDFPDDGAGDKISDADGTFTAADLGPRQLSPSDYDLRLTIEAVPLGLEDTSYLSVHTSCTPAGEVALVGQPLTCATRVDNAGPGLPRNVVATNDVSGGTATANLDSAAWSVTAPWGTGSYGCSTSGTVLSCTPSLVPVAARAPTNIAAVITPTSTGMLEERAEATSPSFDPDLLDNVATTSIEVFRSVALDIEPRDALNVVNLKRGGLVSVAILTTDDFDAATVDVSTVCFGDAGAPGERTCVEVHGTGHLEDVNKDKRLDLLLHFDVAATGIDMGDTSACLKGRTNGGVGIYACDAILTSNK